MGVYTLCGFTTAAAGSLSINRVSAVGQFFYLERRHFYGYSRYDSFIFE